jgi:sister chromatid cohesion protein DCC1
VYYELSEEKVCQFYAELLLRPAGKVSKILFLVVLLLTPQIKISLTQTCIYMQNYCYFDQFNFDEFMESWQQSVPDGMTTSLGQLKVRSWHASQIIIV